MTRIPSALLVRVLNLLYVIVCKVKPGRKLNEYAHEKHKYTVRYIIINQIDTSYHTKLMHIKDRTKLFLKIKEMKNMNQI